MADEQLDMKDMHRTDLDYHRLVSEHQALDARITNLSSLAHLTDQQHFEQAALKKQKLQLKDRIEALRRGQHVAGGATSVSR